MSAVAATNSHVPSTHGGTPAWVNRRNGARPPATLSLRLAAGVVAFLSLLPLGYLLIRAWEVGPDLWPLLTRPRSIAVLMNSLLLTAAVTLTSTVIGVTMAWLTVRTDLPGRNGWAAITCLPLVLPSYVGAFALISALGPSGMLQTMLAPLGVQQLPSIYGFPGAWLALTLFAYPYVQLSVRAGLRGLDPSMEDAARSLGRSGGQVFREITLRHLRPSIGAGALLVALYTLSDFGAVSLLQFNAFTREIYIQYSAALDRSGAAALALLLVALTVVILGIESRTRGRSHYVRAGTGTARRQRLVKLGGWTLPALIFCFLVSFFALGIPVLVTGYWLLRGWRAGVQFESQWDLIANSVTASGLASVLAVVAALPVVVYAVRHPGRVSRGMERCAYLGHALPGIVVALSLVFLGARYASFLYQTLLMLVFAYTLLFLPLALGTLKATMLQISPRTEEAARTLGRTSRQALRSVTLPQLRSGLWMGMALVFLTCMKELPASLILGPTGFQTLATRIWGATEEALFARAAVPALILVGVSAISLGLLLRHEDEALKT
jgi:iron(III) transport system permease protein